MRVLIADDHEVVRKGVRSLLLTQRNLDICGEAVDGRDAVEKAKLLLPDLILMDISMPILNGLEATREIRSILPQTEVIILSQHETFQMAQEAFLAGALGYVVKSSVSRNLFAALETVGRHEAFFDPGIAGSADRQIDAQELVQGTTAPERARFQLAAIVDSSYDAIISKDLNAIITSWNASAERLFGYTAEEAIGQPITIIIPPELLEEETQILRRLKSGERIDQYETVRVTKAGKRRNVSLSISPVRDSAGKIVGASKIARDITERKRLDETARGTKSDCVARWNSKLNLARRC
jgi:PAS domain S-box-containing protein